jgi:hypothetical protein
MCMFALSVADSQSENWHNVPITKEFLVLKANTRYMLFVTLRHSWPISLYANIVL